MKTVYLSLGSNIGDRERHLRDAIRRLNSDRLRVSRVSPVYETEPVDYTDQPCFLNLVAEAETDLFPMQVLAYTSRIERALGRVRAAPKGPRTIDIDILLYGNIQISAPKLQIPHPRLADRRFVLAPLADLAPDLRHPVTGRSIRELLGSLQGQTVRNIHT
ncbi:MAG TPA: 2-amino-4-hydroxy-6-hydroxymethyldihydropteridine diphosphokinase [Candidatus Sulfopaludibacter sp.]|nr:2-amino-4-hydroxy-6-hydroxymethyldihydropteridine diphosphokinase [Candidatus Sulfopaludibacter sp.]